MKSALDLLDEEIASLGGQLNVVTHRLLVKIRAFDKKDGWAPQGFLSCAHYLSYRIGLSPSAAREKIRVAHAIGKLPKINAALESGALSYSKARALTRVAEPETEADLLAMANDVSAAALDRIITSLRRVENSESAAKKEAARAVSYHLDDDGMFVLQARLLPEEGAIVRKALELSKIKLDDAFVQMAERSLGGVEASGDRYQVTVHVDAEVLASDAAHGRAEIEGHGASTEVCRRLSCDASVIAMVHDKNGNIVHAGRKTRTISTPLRRKLKERDGYTCRFPGCTNKFTDGHHVRHWCHGGETTLENLISLCRSHHRFVHEFGYAVKHDASGRFVFKDALGRPIPNTPRAIDTPSLAQIPAAEPIMPRCTSIDYHYVIQRLLDR